MKAPELLESVNLLSRRDLLPDGDALAAVFDAAASSLETLPEVQRPRRSDGRSGALVDLAGNLPTLLLPDLHARPEVLLKLLRTQLSRGRGRVAELLESRELQVVMLGDGPHSEGPEAPERWSRAFAEFRNGWRRSRAMTEEMTLALNAMEIVARLLVLHPGFFYFLKGNHENILNREGGGDHAFGKFAYEGTMVLSWCQDILGQAFLNAYDRFEKALPLAAVGHSFLATHAEPAFPLTREDLVEARSRPEIIEALTWTANDAAAPDAVAKTLMAVLPDQGPPGLAFGGHRPVAHRFALRAGGRFVQIHDVDRAQAALVLPGQPFDPARDLFDLG